MVSKKIYNFIINSIKSVMLNPKMYNINIFKYYITYNMSYNYYNLSIYSHIIHDKICIIIYYVYIYNSLIYSLL